MVDFTADELELVLRVSSAAARGLRITMLAGVPHLVPGVRAPAVWVLDERYQVVQATPGSETLLAALRDEENPTDETPEPLVALAVMAATLARRASPYAVPHVPTFDGDWLTLYASVLRSSSGAASQIAITSSAASSAELLDLTLLSYHLTPAECAAVTLVLSGRSTKQIAEELVLSPHTVQDRMQDVFAKVGVRSRRELVAKLTD